MKLITLATASTLAITSSLAYAQETPDPQGVPSVVMDSTPGPQSSAVDYRIPLALLLLVGIVVAVGGDSGSSSSSSTSTETSTTNLSDMRLKTDIRRIGTAANGLPLYHFSYLFDDATYEGVMAQDVLLHTPDAVVTLPSGYHTVDYGQLGLSMRAVN